MSPRWKRQLGYEPSELPDTVESWLSLLADGEKDRAFAAVDAHLKQNEPYDLVLRYTKKTGEIAHMRSRGVAVCRDGEAVRMIGTHTDVSELVQARQDLQHALSDLESRNKYLDDFAHIISHDLKAPLRGITTLVPWLVDSLSPDATEDTLENLDFLADRAEAMRTMIDGVLDYSSATRTHLRGVPCSTRQAMDRVLLALVPTVDVQVLGELPIVLADPTQLQQVMQNLVGNAIRHAQATQVVVWAEPRDDQWVLHIDDDGVGLPEGRLDSVFELFSSQGSGRKSAGLAICRTLVERMDGQIGVTSVLGEGSKFWFSLPNADPLS